MNLNMAKQEKKGKMSKISKLLRDPKLFFKDMISKHIHKKNNKAIPISAKKTYSAQKCDISYYRDQLLNFKNAYPVASLKYRHIFLWPVLRFGLWRGLRQSWQNNGTQSRIIPLKTIVSPNAYKCFRDSYKFMELKNVKKQHKDFLVFSNVRGVEQIYVNGKIYNKYTDPIYEGLQKVGSVAKIEIIKGDTAIDTKRHHKPISILPPLTREIGYMIEADIPEDFAIKLQQFFPSLSIQQKDIVDTIEWFMRDYNLYREVLKKFTPKAVFFLGFEFHLALSAVASDLNIRAVDVQHGLQTGWGPLYKWWDEMPSKKFTTLPSDFIVWGNRDKKHLLSEIASNGKANVYIGGFPWIGKQFQFASYLQQSTLELFRKYKIKVLISLQHQNIIPANFIQLIDYSIINIRKNLRKNITNSKLQIDDINKIIEKYSQNQKLSAELQNVISKKAELENQKNYFENELDLINNKIDETDILWILRKHPKSKKSLYHAIFNKKNVIVSDEIDMVQVGVLLKEVDFHITSSSTVVIEADYFGVHNFIVDEDKTGFENYRQEIENGTVSMLHSPRDFYNFIWNNEIKKESKIDAIEKNVDLQKVLQEIAIREN
jgi:hypothetical protein